MSVAAAMRRQGLTRRRGRVARTSPVTGGHPRAGADPGPPTAGSATPTRTALATRRVRGRSTTAARHGRMQVEDDHFRPGSHVAARDQRPRSPWSPQRSAATAPGEVPTATGPRSPPVGDLPSRPTCDAGRHPDHRPAQQTHDPRQNRRLPKPSEVPRRAPPDPHQARGRTRRRVRPVLHTERAHHPSDHPDQTPAAPPPAPPSASPHDHPDQRVPPHRPPHEGEDTRTDIPGAARGPTGTSPAAAGPHLSRQDLRRHPARRPSPPRHLRRHHHRSLRRRRRPDRLGTPPRQSPHRHLKVLSRTRRQ